MSKYVDFYMFASGDAGVAALPSAYLDAELANIILLIGANSYETQSLYFLEHMLPNLSGAIGAPRSSIRPWTRRLEPRHRKKRRPS